MTAMRSAAPGFYGKLPARGDFVRRRLPSAFVAPWDQLAAGGDLVQPDHVGQRLAPRLPHEPTLALCSCTRAVRG